MKTTPEILSGVVHEIPDDLQKILLGNTDLLEVWNGLTALARNEWICWLTIVKKDETRIKNLARLQEDLMNKKDALVVGQVAHTAIQIQKNEQRAARNISKVRT